jgi:AcrR family transcriptional regulator
VSVAATRPSFAEATRALLRERLLDAADELLREHGRSWGSVSMADIAGGAGVSRQTLYNEFGSREDFAQAYVLREVDRFLGAVERAVADHLDDPRAAVAAAFGVFLSAAEHDPLVRSIVSGDGSDGLLALVTTHGGPVLAAATERLASFLVAGWSEITLDDARLIAECVVRLAISHAGLPTGPADLTAASVATLLGPYLDQLLLERGGAVPAERADTTG